MVSLTESRWDGDCSTVEAIVLLRKFFVGLVMEKSAGQCMELLARRFGSSVSLSDKERGGIKIEKKDTHGALLGFHHSIVAEVFSTKVVNENGFIDQFTSLWPGKEGVSIRALRGARFMARFVGRRDMYRVLEVDKPWVFCDDLVLVVDGARHTRWAEPLFLTTMWVQVHNVPPLNMTEAVTTAIGGLIGTVLKVDKDDGRDCIGRFLRVRISFDVSEYLMWGANVEFPNDGGIWVDFRYEGCRTIVLYVVKWDMLRGCVRRKLWVSMAQWRMWRLFMLSKGRMRSLISVGIGLWDGVRM